MKDKNGSEYTKIQSKIKYFIFLVLYYFLYPIAKILYGGKNNWLICEMCDYAQDNGYIFYEFLLKNHPEINPIYLLNKNHPQFTQISKIGRIVPFYSIRHFLMAIGCHVKISSQIYGYAPWIQMATFFRRNKTRDLHVFLQHGIIKNTHDNLFGDVCKSLDLFVCGAKPEYEFIKKDFHYYNDVPKYTGLARFDKLTDFKTNNQLLFMPTWRSKLKNISETEFVNSNFFLNWNSLLNDKLLLDYCTKHDLRIVFYLHHELQKFSKMFFSNSIVSIEFNGHKTVQQLLKESKILITDFSSVYFDFAYMKKPMVYFQFDESTFYDMHYKKGYFDYRRDGFGPVCITHNDVVKSVIDIAENNFVLNTEYLRRIDLNFLYRDNKNCERIYNAIKEIENRK